MFLEHRISILSIALTNNFKLFRAFRTHLYSICRGLTRHRCGAALDLRSEACNLITFHHCSCIITWSLKFLHNPLQVPQLKVFVYNQENNQYCKKEQFLGNYLEQKGSWFRISLPISGFEWVRLCSLWKSTTPDNAVIDLKNLELRCEISTWIFTWVEQITRVECENIPSCCIVFIGPHVLCHFRSLLLQVWRGVSQPGSSDCHCISRCVGLQIIFLHSWFFYHIVSHLEQLQLILPIPHGHAENKWCNWSW
jgi:hypothetical protein